MCPSAGQGPAAASQEEQGCPFDGLPEGVQLRLFSLAKEPQAACVSRGWLRLVLQSAITLHLDLSVHRSPAAQSFWREQLAAPLVRMRLLLLNTGRAEVKAPAWLRNAIYPGIMHLVS
jgi:hypothetical protein